MKPKDVTPAKWAFLPVWIGLVAGCAGGPTLHDQALLADKELPAAQVGPPYTVACPDVLDVTVDGRPDLSGPQEVGPDGCIQFGPVGRVRVEGLTTVAAARVLAEAAGISDVRVGVAAYRSQQIQLTGQVVGGPRVVPYQGPETVLALLRRVGGLTPGAALGEVYLVRSRVAEGKQPEVHRIDLPAILLKQDQTTNLLVQPFDHVFVGETRQSCLARCLPPCVRPVYEAVCKLNRKRS